MAATQDESLIETAFRMALLARRPGADLLFHSERGAQYTSEAHRAFLTQAGVTVSMSRTGNCYDNAVVESFFGTLKGEWVLALDMVDKSISPPQTNVGLDFGL